MSKPNGSKVPAPMSRKRERREGDEEVGTDLKLGELQEVPTFSLSEAQLVINSVLDQRKKLNIPFQETETLVGMQDYLNEFARFKSKEHIEAVESLLSARPELVAFERSQLATLSCETADEAKTLIPSIQHKISDIDLKELLEEISRVRTFV